MSEYAKQKTFENRAFNITDENDNMIAYDTTGTDMEEMLVFAMRDNEHDFSLGISTVLECLKAAEQIGYVPRLPDEWWFSIQKDYF